MSKYEITPAIMIGGAGSRLWPLSRADRPKQFLSLTGEASMFQQTMLRVKAPGFAAPWLLANRDTLGHVNRQLDEMRLEASGIVVEPGMRGTAAAIAAIAQVLSARRPDTLILVAPADHYMADEERFRKAVREAAPIAASGRIVTFGITPTAPETGFGYIAPGDLVEAEGAVACMIGANGFREKPNRADAERFVADGYLWNAGIFLFSAEAMLAEIARLAPQTFAAVSAACASGMMRDTPHGLIVEPKAEAFLQAPLELSIDVAVMERTDRAAVVPLSDSGWSDVGSLSALWEIARKDENGNALIGDALLHECRNSFVRSGAGRKIVAAHLDDVLIVDTEDALIVLPSSKAQSVKTIVGELRAMQAAELAYEREALFGWGEVHIDRNGADHVALSLRLKAAGRITRYRCAVAFETWVVTSGEVALDMGDGVETLGSGNTIHLRNGDVMSLVAAGGEARLAVTAAGLNGRSLSEVFAPAVAMPGRQRGVASLEDREVA